MEHRCGKRTPVDIDVRLIGASGVTGVGRMLDVSATGAFIHTLIELPVLTPVYIEPLDLRRPFLEARGVAAFVARRTTSGLGLEWAEFLPAIVSEWISRSRAEALATRFEHGDARASIASRGIRYDRRDL
jgi:hypothetical protein